MPDRSILLDPGQPVAHRGMTIAPLFPMASELRIRVSCVEQGRRRATLAARPEQRARRRWSPCAAPRPSP